MRCSSDVLQGAVPGARFIEISCKARRMVQYCRLPRGRALMRCGPARLDPAFLLSYFDLTTKFACWGVLMCTDMGGCIIVAPRCGKIRCCAASCGELCSRFHGCRIIPAGSTALAPGSATSKRTVIVTHQSKRLYHSRHGWPRASDR